VRDRWLTLGVLTVVAVTAVTTVAQAGPKAERLTVSPNAPRVAVTATMLGGTLSIEVEGVRPGARLTASIDRLACGADYATGDAGTAVADESGRARWHGDVPATARDGDHVLAISAGGRVVGCGPIPSRQPAKEDGSQHFRVWTFARHFLD
jgi:hypothetical protein